MLCMFQVVGNIEVGSPGRIRTYSLSVNSRNDRKSKCPIWCRLREIGSHFSLFSCTHTCTHSTAKVSRFNSPSVRPECLMRSFSLLAGVGGLANDLCILSLTQASNPRRVGLA